MDSPTFTHQLIRPVNKNDLEYLRIWKNKYKKYFFFQKNISPEEQLKWYEGYLQRENDYMFAVMAPENSIVGCMGIRLNMADQYWDIYNVMRGSVPPQGLGLMSKGLREMINFALHKQNILIQLVVVKGNPAIQWYKKNGFLEINEEGQGVVMYLGLDKFP